jgi:sarcosine oxidase delta subunit
MEIWGHCRRCDAWFAVPSDTVSALVATRCDCGQPPERFEQRLGELVIELDVTGGRRPDTPLQGVG